MAGEWNFVTPTNPGWYWWCASIGGLGMILLLSAGKLHSVLELDGLKEWPAESWPHGGVWREIPKPRVKRS